MVPLDSIIEISIILFAAAATIGWIKYKSIYWHTVDVIYYPLAAIGIVLLFLSNDIPRQIIETNRVTNAKRAELTSIASAKPRIDVRTNESLFMSSLELLGTIPRWESLCSSPPQNDPMCFAGQKLFRDFSKFQSVMNSDYPSFEFRLSSTCDAGDQLIRHIDENESLSKTVSQSLVSQYKHAISMNYHSLAYEAVVAEADDFERRTLASVEDIHRAAFPPGSQGQDLLLKITKSEIVYAKTILLGLFPCIVAPRNELSTLVQWTETKRTRENEVRDLQRKRDELIERDRLGNPARDANLKYWPFALIFALALKFAKGLAGYREKVAPHIWPNIMKIFSQKIVAIRSKFKN